MKRGFNVFLISGSDGSESPSFWRTRLGVRFQSIIPSNSPSVQLFSPWRREVGWIRCKIVGGLTPLLCEGRAAAVQSLAKSSQAPGPLAYREARQLNILIWVIPSSNSWQNVKTIYDHHRSLAIMPVGMLTMHPVCLPLGIR